MIPIFFKDFDTSTIRQYYVNPYWSLNQLYNELKDPIKRDFNINESDLQFVDTNICYKDKTLPIDTYPVLSKNNHTLLCDMWGIRLTYLFIYIYKPRVTLLREIGDCMVCFEETELQSYYICNHKMCNRCYIQCINRSILNCPYCRETCPVSNLPIVNRNQNDFYYTDLSGNVRRNVLSSYVDANGNIRIYRNDVDSI